MDDSAVEANENSRQIKMFEKTKNTSWVFNLYNDSQGIPRRLAEGLRARVFVGVHAMLSVVRIEPGTTGRVHSHPEEQWGVLVEGECIRIQDGMEVAVKSGDFWYTPGHVKHGIRTESKGAVILDIFSPPRSEYKKTGEGFGGQGEESL
jgi:quercetin dioxygenase-like cupin family protein